MTGFLLLLAAFIGLLAYRHVSARLRELSAQLLRQQQEHARLTQHVAALQEELRSVQAAPAAAARWNRPAEEAVTPAPVVAPPPPVAAPVARPPVEVPVPVVPIPPRPVPVPAAEALPVARPVPPPVTPPLSPTLPLPPPPRPAVPEPVVPAEPTWWDRTEQVLLDNWTGILGAVVLVTGVGFLGVYTALQVTPPVRFGMISAFAGLLLGGHFYLRTKAFAAQLHVWLQSSAAAIFLFACVGAVSVPGLQWVGPPMSYALLLLGVGANLWLAWKTSREAVATLHGVLSLVALTVIPPTLLTLGAAAAVTAFSIGITWRQQWKYQLVLSIASFFAFHQYWHYHLTAPADGGQRLGAMALVVGVGVAAAVVQYRRVYAAGGFDALLFTAHVLNWTCLGVNLYQYSTGSVWKTIPLGLGAGLTFAVARVARRMGIRWLYRTDSIISLLLALFTAFSLQGWHATGSLVLLFMLAETLLIGFVMVREGEHVVFRVAAGGALLALLALVGLNLAQLVTYSGVELPRNAGLLLLAGGLGAAFYRLTYPQLVGDGDDKLVVSRQLHEGFGWTLMAPYLTAAALLAQALFGPKAGNAPGLLALTVGAAGAVFGLAWWVRPVVDGWLRSLHLLCGQALLVVALLGLHEVGLTWPTTFLLLYLESLLMLLALAFAKQWDPYRVLLFAGLVLAGALPVLIYQLDPDLLTDSRRALLLVLAALGTTGALAGLERLGAPALDVLPFSPQYGLRLLGLATGVLMLAAFGLVYTLPWAAWVAGGVGAAWLLLRRQWPVAGLWEGLLLAVAGACALEWSYVLPVRAGLSAGAALAHLAPLLVPIGVGVGVASWWAERGRHLRAPWIYLLGVHLALGVWAVLAIHGRAWPVLAWVALAAALAGLAPELRARYRDDDALTRAGRPDRYVRHLLFGLTGLALAVHFTALMPSETLLLGVPARRPTAVALLLLLGGLAWQRPPADGLFYRSWRWQALFPELTLLFAVLTIAREVRVSWETLAWMGLAFGLTFGGRVLPARLRRVQAYGIGFYWLTALWTSYVALRYLHPGQLLSAYWLTTAGAVGLLFGYTAVALGQARNRPAPADSEWPPVLAPLAALTTLRPRQLVVALLYPAFVALTVLLVQSFDRSVLTVLLMLEVVAVFVSSLVLRRPDLRYAALLGVAICLIRLVFFDLSQRGTVTRAVVFILMGLLLLGMNALYARFKDRFSAERDDD